MGSGGASDGADELRTKELESLLAELRAGVAVRPLVAQLAVLVAAVDELDPAQLPARDAMDVVRVLDRMSRVVDAAKALAAGRVADSSLWKRSGHRSAAHWMAAVTGVGVGDAVKLLQTAETVAEAPATRDALVAGKVSPRQARAAGRAEKADPEAGRRLLDTMTGRSPGAGSPSVVESEKEATRIVNAAAGETPEQVAARHHKARRFRHGTTADGMGWGSWLLPPAEHTAVIAQLEAEQQQIFVEKRATGEHEPLEAYAADALMRILRRARQRGSNSVPAGADSSNNGGVAEGSVAVLKRDGHPETDGPAGVSDRSGGLGSGDVLEDDWSFAKVIVKVDLSALDRGHLSPGEVCEVAGQGPIPAADVWRMIDGNAFVAAVATKGVEISKVVHLGRRPTALQRTALEWISDGTCTIDDCTSRARLEVDHVADWAATHRTQLTELTQACGHHHDLKTHHGYRFGPLGPDGRRALIPPHDHDTGPPRLTVHDHDPPDEGTGPPGDAGQAGGPARPARGPREELLTSVCHSDFGPARAVGADPVMPRESADSPTPPRSPVAPGLADPAARARALARRRAAQGHLFDTG